MFTIISVLSTFFIYINFSNSISITGLVDMHKPEEPLLLVSNMKKKPHLRSEGIFERFLRNLLDLLSTTFPEKKLIKYCRTLYKCTSELDYKYARKLSRHLRYMSRMYREDLKNELILYRQELKDKKEHATSFIDAMNSIFTLREHILFEDYIYELKNYGTDDKLFIDEETEKLINNVIMDRILKLSSKDRDDLHTKLRLAVREYKREPDIQKFV